MVEVEKIRFYGSPWTNQAMMGFSAPNKETRKEIWDKIPPNTDILLTHSPPFGIQDKNSRGQNCGCTLLTEKVREIAPKVHLFGHVHESYGWSVQEGVTYINASNIMSKNVFFPWFLPFLFISRHIPFSYFSFLIFLSLVDVNRFVLRSWIEKKTRRGLNKRKKVKVNKRTREEGRQVKSHQPPILQCHHRILH